MEQRKKIESTSTNKASDISAGFREEFRRMRKGPTTKLVYKRDGDHWTMKTVSLNP